MNNHIDFDIFSDDNTSKDNVTPPKIIRKEESGMTSLEIDAAIDTINGLCKRAVSSLKTAKNNHFNNLEDSSWGIYLLEKALLSARTVVNEIVCSTDNIIASKSLEHSTISVEVSESFIKLLFPILLNKRKQNLRTEYYPSSVESVLKNITIPDKFKTKHISIIFLHCYEIGHSVWAKRDHDNIDLKWVVDTLNNHFFIDDGPFRTNLLNFSTIDDEDKTIIYLVPTTILPAFLEEHLPIWISE